MSTRRPEDWTTEDAAERGPAAAAGEGDHRPGRSGPTMDSAAGPGEQAGPDVSRPPRLRRVARMLRQASREDGTPRYLIPGETEVGRARQHWVVLLRPAAWLLGSVVVAGLLVGASAGVERFASVLILAAVLNLFARMLAWWDFAYVVTDKRVLQVSSLPTPRVASMSLRKMTDMSYRRTLLGLLLDYGTFHIESAGQNQALSRLQHVARPQQFYERLTTQVFMGGSSKQDF